LGPGRLLLAAALISLPLGAAACGGRFTLPPNVSGSAKGGATRTAPPESPTTSSTVATSSSTEPAGSSRPGSPATSTTVPRTPPASGNSTQDEITKAYEAFLVDLSNLDDTLNKAYVGPLASVTTNRLAQATVRQAAAILSAQEHGVGTLRDDHLAVTMTGATSAALADCQDEEHFYLVSNDSGTPDPFVARGYFVGSAQLVLQDGHWLVDTFTTTHATCTF
jgi:hypothetical protein